MEAAAASELAENFVGDPTFQVPAVDWRRTARRVLTLEWLDGIKLSKRDELIAAGHDPKTLAAILERGLLEGGLGLGVAHQYYPGATREEIFRVFQMAARWNVPVFTHVRGMNVDAMQEVISNAAVTGASPSVSPSVP